MTRRFPLRALAQPSQAWSDDPVPCKSTSGLESPRGPSSRRWTRMPATSPNTEGGGAQRACSSSTVSSGAQFAATKAPINSIGASTPQRITINAVFMAPCRDRSWPPLPTRPVETGLPRSERPGSVSADGYGARRVGAVRLLGRRLGPEHRAGLEVILAPERVAHEMGVRGDDNPLLALGILDHDAGIAGASERATHRTGRLDEAVGHGAIGRAVPSFIVMAAVGLRPGEDAQLDRLLATIGLRHPAGADIVAWLDVRECRLQHRGDRHVVGKLEGDRSAVGPLPVDRI